MDCFDGDVVMYGDGDEDAGADKVWSGPYALDSLHGLFTTGYHVGFSNSNGWDLSLPRYWFFMSYRAAGSIGGGRDGRRQASAD